MGAQTQLKGEAGCKHRHKLEEHSCQQGTPGACGRNMTLLVPDLRVLASWALENTFLWASGTLLELNYATRHSEGLTLGRGLN